MWIFTNNAFVSAVQHRDKPGSVMVRARVAGDLERMFPRHKSKIERTPGADYLYRVTVHKTTFAAVVARAAGRIDYGNFKDSVEERDRHDAYMGVWSAMYRLQHEREPTFDGFGPAWDEGDDREIVELPVFDMMTDR